MITELQGAADIVKELIRPHTFSEYMEELEDEANGSAATWTSTTAEDRIRALTASHRIKPTSTRCRSAWQPNPGRGSTYRSGKAVQKTGTTPQLGVLSSQLTEALCRVFV